MAKKKLKRILALPGLENVVNDPGQLKGKWGAGYFKNGNPITLELGCGKGDVAVALAQKHPEGNFIGIDLKGARLYIGAKRGIEYKLTNLCFIQMNIEKIADVFAPGEVREIWITFPDPFPQKARAKKRLTSPKYMALYRQILDPGGIIHFKTDDPGLYQYTLETLGSEGCLVEQATEDVDQLEEPDENIFIRTTYEKRHIEAGKDIKYIRFRFQR